MDDHIAIIRQHPFGLLKTLQAERQFTGLAFDGKADFLGNRLDLALVGAGADHEIVGERGDLAQIQNLDIGRLLGFRRADCDKPGGNIDFVRCALVRFDFVRIGWLRVRLGQNTLLWVCYYRCGAATGQRLLLPAPQRRRIPEPRGRS